MKRMCFFLLAISLLFFGGCSDYNELNMQELVRSAGVDFEEGQVVVSVACEAKEENVIIKASGESFFEAVRQMSGTAGKKLYWGHAQTIAFGENALSKKLPETLDAVLRARDVYLDIIPVAVKGARAEEALSAKEGGAIDAFINEENSRRFRAYPLWELLRAKEVFGVYVIPTVEKKGEAFVMSGGAVVSDKGLLGYLTGDEFLLLDLLTHKGAGGYLPTIKVSDDAFVSFEILANEFKTKKEDSSFYITQKITLSPAEVKGDLSREQMQQAAAKYLSEGYKKLFLHAREDNFGNIFKFFDAGENFNTEVYSDIRISNVFGGE